MKTVKELNTQMEKADSATTRYELLKIMANRALKLEQEVEELKLLTSDKNINETKVQAIEEMADYYSNALIISVSEMRNYAKRLRGEK